MVETEGTELPTPHPVIEPVSGNRRTEFFDAETEGQKPHFRLAETDTETNVDSKSPRSAGQMHGYRAEFDTYGLGGGDGMVRTGCPPRSPIEPRLCHPP